MATQYLSDLDLNSQSRILNLLDPTLAQHAATKAYVDALVEGLNWKDNARVYVQTNVTVASPGATLDGVSMAVNDRVVLAAQTTASENGIYIWNGAATPMTRSNDANTSSEITNAVVVIDAGTSANAAFRQTAVAPTLGSTAIAWATFGSSAPAATTGTAGIAALATQAEVDAGAVTNKIVTPQTLAAYANLLKRFAVTIGDGSSTSLVVTHNLNSRDIEVEVYRNSGNFDSVLCDVQRTSVNAVTLLFATAPAANAFRAVVHF